MENMHSNLASEEVALSMYIVKKMEIFYARTVLNFPNTKVDILLM
jgi:hypothetical protein